MGIGAGKAYGQYSDNHAWFGANTPQEGADGGGRPEPVIKLFTGSDATNEDLSNFSKVEMAKKLEAATADHKAIVTGINRDASWKYIFGLNSVQSADQFSKQHEYSITGFNPDGHGDGTVEIRNPLGGKDGSEEGTIRIPVAQYMKNFSDVSIQK